MIPPYQDFDKTVNEIINSSKYRHLHNFLRNLIDNIKDSLTKWFIEKLASINWSVTPAVSENLSTILIVVASLIIVAIIVVVIISISRGFERRSRVSEILGEKIDETTTPDSFREKAKEMHKGGDFREAVRYDFIALLFLMHEETIIYLDKAETNQEIYYQLLEKEFPELNRFYEMIDIFNLTWYGHKLCTENMLENWDRDMNLLWNEVMNYETK